MRKIPSHNISCYYVFDSEGMSEARQRVQDLSARLAALDAEIAMLRTTLVNVERGACDADLPRLYMELLNSATLSDVVVPGKSGASAASSAAGGSASAGGGARGAGDGAGAATAAGRETGVSESARKDGGGLESSSSRKSASVKADHRKSDAEAGASSATAKEAPEPRTRASRSVSVSVSPQPETVAADGNAEAELQALQPRLETVLTMAMRRDRDTRFFDHKVTPEEAPMYASEILCPCDFGLLKRRQKRGRYAWPACTSVQEACALFTRDLMLVFANAAVFNPPGSESGVLELSRKIMQSSLKHLAENKIWPLPTAEDAASLLSRRRASRASTVSSSSTVKVEVPPPTPAVNDDSDFEPTPARSPTSAPPPNKRRKR